MDRAELTVLVVDDDFRVANLHAGIVTALPGFTVGATVNSIAAARTALAAGAFDLALVDVYLPDGSGVDLVRELACDAMMLTAATESETVRAALSAGALGYLVKPFDHAALAARLAGYARYRRLLAAPEITAADVDAALAA
ncbi:response regulator, partial [Nocardia sp. NPDC004582]